MKVYELDISDIKIIIPDIFIDKRGYFYESFNNKKFNELIGLNVSFVQDNRSSSTQGVLRGLHYQLPPSSQGKLINVTKGEILDVAVDIRKSSPSFGKYVSCVLSSENKKQLWIPEGFAHGFLTLSSEAEVFYKTTNYYSPSDERCLLWNDDKLNINWPNDHKISLSEKDLDGSKLINSEVFD